MNAAERYRALIEARESPTGAEGLGQYYLRSARLHAPGGALVYSRAAIVDFFAGAHDQRAQSPAAPQAPEIISSQAPGATLIAAHYRPVSAATTCLSLAVMRGEWINEEWLFGPEPARNVPEQVEPKRMDLFSAFPGSIVERPPESMPGAASARRPVAAALEAFHRGCNQGREDALDSIYAQNATLDLADGETEPGQQSAAEFYARLWRGFSDPVLYAEKIVAPAEDAPAAVLWHLTGGAPDASRPLHLRGLSFWRFDAAGHIIADSTRFDTVAVQREREADAAAWQA